MNPAILLLGTIAPVQPDLPLADPAPAVSATGPLSAFVSEDAPEPVLNEWTGSVAIGAVFQDGNTDERSANANARAEYRRERDRWTATAFWNYGENKDPATNDYVLNTRKGGVGIKYDYFLSKKLYVFGNASMEADLLADIKRRDFVGAGVGYQWREDDSLKWGSELGAGYFSEDHYDDEDDEYISARAANNIQWQLNEKTSLANYLTVFPSLEDSDDVYGRSDTVFKTTLTEAMFLQLQWVWDYDNTPATGKDRNDNTITLGLGWSF